MKERRWYGDWRVWLCFGLVASWWVLEKLLLLPFRLFDTVWSWLFR